QNHLSILPYLQVSTSNNASESNYAIRLLNHGVGPALIESVNMSYKGKRTNLQDFNDELFPYLISLDPALDSIKNFSSATVNKGIAIPANSAYPLLEIKNSAEDYFLLTERLLQLEQAGLEYEIIYKSIQNERWMIRENSDGPIKLD
ncbi:MAG: hypothetical protein HKP08_13030, partial [Flavobacteriaceae bacterium]|nr:hypothetical protein [Flavobacteriaceae bacterium]